MIPKIFPRNLTARAAMRVPGNPDTTRLESGVGNCFPGLEFDHRNLDRRFFPGLVFEFGEDGAQLLTVEPDDPDVSGDLARDLRAAKGRALRNGTWFLSAMTQAGKRIEMPKRGDLAMLHWRLVRCLEPGPVTIELERREETRSAPAQTVELAGMRRTFVYPTTGVISSAYAAGELTQSLCSPWMHDFRDCACFYWASNHPDIVLAEDPPAEPALPGAAPEGPLLELTPIDWLRRDRSSHEPAKPTESAARGAQMDYYEINARWQELSIVLRGHEVSNIYTPDPADDANPFSSPDELADQLVHLARLEHTVALQYLYARYSLKNPADAGISASLRDDLTFVWHELLVIAVSEMRHLRWANQLLWSLHHDGLIEDRGPSLGVADKIPAPTGTRMPGGRGVVTEMRPPELLPLTPNVLEAFIAIEEPSGYLDGQYARVLSTLRQPLYRPTLEQLAARIVADGAEHFSRFREVQLVLKKYERTLEYLQPDFEEAPATDPAVAQTVQTYDRILQELKDAYKLGDMEDAAHIATARSLMFTLDAAARQLGSKSRGIPFFGTAITAGTGTR